MRTIHVVVKPGSKNGPYIQLGLDGSLLVCVREPALDGKANRAVVKELARHLDLPPSTIQLKTGATSKYKVFTIKG